MVVKLLMVCITYTHSYSINLIIWRRLAVCSQNVAVHIQSDNIVRQWLHFSFESVIYHDDQLKLIWWCKAWLVLWKKKKAIREGCGACSHLLPQNLNEFLLKARWEIWWGVINGSNFLFSMSIQRESFTG